MFPFSKPCGDLPWGARDSPAHGTMSVFEQELQQRTPGMLQGLQAGGGKGIAGGYGDEGIRAVPTHLAGLLHLQGARGMGAGCHKLSSHVQGGDIRAGAGASPLGSLALAGPKHVGSWLQGGSFVTTWVSNHIKGCGERLAAFGHGQTWDRGCGCPQPHPSLSSGTFPTSPSAQLGRDLSQ